MKAKTSSIVLCASILLASTQSFADNDINLSGPLNIDPGSVLDLSIDNNSVIATRINIGENANLIVGSGSIESGIYGASDGVGNVKFAKDNVLFANVGTPTTSLANVEIGSGANLVMGSRNIDAIQIILDENSILNYGSGTITGAVDGKLSGAGNFTFNNTKTTAFSIGQNNILDQINVANGATITLGDNIAADTINIGFGTSGKIRTNGKNISSNQINLASGAVLEIGSESLVSGEISGAGQVLISNNSTVNLNNVVNTDNITIGDGGNTILNQNGGQINSLIRLSTGAVFNYNGGELNGAVRGTSSNKGTFNINANYTNNSKIGQSYALSNLNVASDVVMNVNADIAANNILIEGALNLGNSSKIITGNLATSGGATIDLGNANHKIIGDFQIGSDDILKLTALNNLNVGSLAVSGNSSVAQDVNLQISFDPLEGYFSSGSKIKIISSASGSVHFISNDNIDVNNSGSNKSGLFTFQTINFGGDLFLLVDKKDVREITSNKSAQNVYLAVDRAGVAAQGEIRNLQKLIDNDQTSDLVRENALKSIIPQGNDQINNSAINSVLSATNTVNSRLDNILLGTNTNQNFRFKSFRNFNFNDEVFDNQAIWIQGFSGSATQNSESGYNYDNQGIVIGVDQEIARNLQLGISASLADATITSNSASRKQTNVNSYQFNLYGGYVWDEYFVSAVVGVAMNKYSAIRTMPDMNLNAKANYDGQTYIAKFESGINKKFASGFFVIPKLGLIAAKNQVATYSENGAGTLNLTVSNEHNNFLETRFGVGFGYDDLRIYEMNLRPKFNLSYGYNLLAREQSSKNNFQNQNSGFVITSPAEDAASVKYGFGFDLYNKDLILVDLEFGAEQKKNYEAKNSSIYIRYKF